MNKERIAHINEWKGGINKYFTVGYVYEEVKIKKIYILYRQDMCINMKQTMWKRKF